MQYGFSKSITLPFDTAVERVTSLLQEEGFGIQTTIDVKETMKKKLGLDVPRYTILGACNPAFAHEALQVDEQIGLLLPCNLIVYEKGGETVVAAFDPMVMTRITDDERIRTIAGRVQEKLRRVIDSV